MKNLLFLLSSLLIFNLVEAKTFHGIIMSDVEDPSIGNACVQNAEKMLKEFKEFAIHNNSKLFVHEFKGEQFSKKEILKHLKNLKPATDDVIFFYYSGHGFYEQGLGKILKLNDEKLALKEIEDILDRKLADLKFIVTDCCSQKIPFGISDIYVTNSREDLTVKEAGVSIRIRSNNYRRLLSYQGLLKVESSQPGQYSYANDEGGVFTNFFLSSIHQHVEKGDATWRDILGKTKNRVEQFIGDEMEKNQIPVSDETNLYQKLNPGTNPEFHFHDTVQQIKH